MQASSVDWEVHIHQLRLSSAYVGTNSYSTSMMINSKELCGLPRSLNGHDSMTSLCTWVSYAGVWVRAAQRTGVVSTSGRLQSRRLRLSQGRHRQRTLHHQEWTSDCGCGRLTVVVDVWPWSWTSDRGRGRLTVVLLHTRILQVVLHARILGTV